MPLLVDACSAINLEAAEALPVVAAIPGLELVVCTGVMKECTGACARTLLQLNEQGRLQLLQEDDLDGELYLTALAAYGLGAGETECLVVAQQRNWDVCTDDRKARNAATELLGAHRLCGSARLLQRAVEHNLVGCEDALNKYQLIQENGGFVPALERKYFCELAAIC